MTVPREIPAICGNEELEVHAFGYDGLGTSRIFGIWHGVSFHCP